MNLPVRIITVSGEARTRVRYGADANDTEPISIYLLL